MSVVVNRGRKMASPEGVWLAIFGHRYEPGIRGDSAANHHIDSRRPAVRKRL